MRWNPRRMSAIRSGGRLPRKAKSPWNSLEVAKIIVGAMTPLLIAGIGIYATQEARRQDAERVKREELKARKQAILPILGEIQTLHQNFSSLRFDLNGAWLELKKAKYPDDGTVPPALESASDEMQKFLGSFDVSMKSNWGKIRIILDDEAKFTKALHYYTEGVSKRLVDQGRRCANDSFVDLVLQSLTKEDVAACSDPFAVGHQAMECLELVELGLENFDKPFDAATSGKAPVTCHAEELKPDATASAASD